MKLTLKLRIAGKADGLTIPIDRLPFLVGRDPVCHLRPVSPFISKHHCVIWSRGDQLLVRDLGSTNGTYLNDHAVTGERQAQNGDLLRIGPLLFDVRIDGPPSRTNVTRLPPTKSATQSADVEDTCAMLLLLGEDAAATTARPVDPLDDDPVPAGKTISVPASALEKSTPQANDGRSKQVSQPANDTAAIAGAVLQKYLRRPRE